MKITMSFEVMSKSQASDVLRHFADELDQQHVDCENGTFDLVDKHYATVGEFTVEDAPE